jgi:putative IMPACT (imprinted ancient) family translation regulator
LDYHAITPLKRLLPDFEAEVLAEEYAVDVTYRLKLPVEQVAPFTDAVTNLTNGQALVDLIDSHHIDSHHIS